MANKDQEKLNISPLQTRFLAYALMWGDDKALAMLNENGEVATKEDVAKWRRTKRFKEAEETVYVDHIRIAQERAAELLPKAIDTLHQQLEAKRGIGADNKARLQAADIILTMNGLKKPKGEEAEQGVRIYLGGFEEL